MEYWEEERNEHIMLPEVPTEPPIPHFSNFQIVARNRMEIVNAHCDTQYEPVTFSTISKIWMGGTDILDYVVCYWTTGDPKQNIPDHWHYVTFGLSDLYGNGIVYPLITKSEGELSSGLGFELTFRLQAAEREVGPPIWPVDLMQKLARYVFSSKSKLIPGDHITWHQPLHGYDQPHTAISHMLITQDFSIPTLSTEFGPVMYSQIVGVTSEEIEIAQRWNAISLLKLFKAYKNLGGAASVTNSVRDKSITEMYPEVKDVISDGMGKDGSDLNGVTARVLWTDKAWVFYDESNLEMLDPQDREEYAFQFPSNSNEDNSTKNVLRNDLIDISNSLGTITLEDSTLIPVPTTKNKNIKQLKCEHSTKPLASQQCFSTIHVTMDTEAAVLIPLALTGRVDHNRHFTFKDSITDEAVTFVPAGMPGAFTAKGMPFVCRGPWLHIQFDAETRDKISMDLKKFFSSDQISLPKNFLWPKAKFAISIVNKT